MLLILVVLTSAARADVLYVDDDARLGGDGRTWWRAYRYLQDALYDAEADPNVTEIRVAAGTYKPDQDEAGNVTSGDRTATFNLVSGVALKGGYAGVTRPTIQGGQQGSNSEGGVRTRLNASPATMYSPDRRDIEAYETTLTGDLAGDDVGTTGIEENAYHIVTADHTSGGILVQGLTITAGNANGEREDKYGGGAYAYDPTLRFDLCRFERNRAAHAGGAAYLGTAYSRCIFIANRARNLGGAVYTVSARISHSRFLGNRCDGRGGATNVSGLLANCEFTGNSAYGGGAVYLGQLSLGYDLAIHDCTFYHNTAEVLGGGLLLEGLGLAFITNSVLWGNSDSAGNGYYSQVFGAAEPRFSCGQGIRESIWGLKNGNIEEDPQFVDPDGPDDIAGTEDDNLRFLSGSPCIDAGSNGAVPADIADLNSNGDFTEPLPFDLDGLPRFVDDPDTPDTGLGAPPIVDMGAYEFQPAMRTWEGVKVRR